jgi:hypothetical protein
MSTEVAGLISADTTWSGDVYVSGSIRVVNGAVLTIEAGTNVVVKAGNDVKIWLDKGASLYANSDDPAKPIIFKGELGSDADWSGIILQDDPTSSGDSNGYVDGSILNNASISNAREAVKIIRQGITIKNTVFRRNTNAIQLVESNSVHISRNHFEDTGSGIDTGYEPSGEHRNLHIIKNKFDTQGTAISIYPNQRAVDNINILDNTITNKSSIGILLGGGGYGSHIGGVKIDRNQIESSTGLSIRAYSWIGTNGVQIANNIFRKNMNAIFFDFAQSRPINLIVAKNIFEGNISSIKGFNYDYSALEVSILENLFRNCSTNIDLPKCQRLDIRRNIFSGTSKRIIQNANSRTTLSENNILDFKGDSLFHTVDNQDVDTPILFSANYLDGASMMKDIAIDGKETFEYKTISLVNSVYQQLSLKEPVITTEHPPTDILLSSSKFSENIAPDSIVAILNGLDPDSGDIFSYSLVSGEGSDDNSAFRVEGGFVRLLDSPDFEEKSSFRIRLQVQDAEGLVFQKAFVLNVLDVYEGIVPVRGDSMYSVVDAPSWTQAEANSVKLGGHLVAINDPGENAFLVEKFRNLGTALNTGDAWIGVNDQDIEGLWKWSSGQSLNYTNWHYNPDFGQEPNNSGGNEDFGILYLEYPGRQMGVGYWNDGAETGVGQGIAETPFIRRGESAYVIVQGLTWEEAEANAVKLGGHLVTINDAVENEFISTVIREEIIKRYSIKYGYGLDSDSAGEWKYNPFIGYSDVKQEGEWKWVDNSPLGFSNWFSGKPNGDSTADYGSMILFGNRWKVDQYGNWVSDPNLIGTWDDTSSGAIGIAEIKLAPNNPPAGTPTITGVLKVGSALTIDVSSIKDDDNFTGYTPAYK